MQGFHVSPFQGTWYPERADELEQLLEDKTEESFQRTGAFGAKAALGFVVPHAGPEYSGTVAAAAYRAIAQLRPERIVVLAFPHHGGLRGVAVPDVASIATPLGPVAIDGAFLPGLPRVNEARVCDHSFEIQLPFLQKAAPDARVTAVYVGPMPPDERARAGAAIAGAWLPGVVFVASSDFTHYGRRFEYTPFPADHAVEHRLRELDNDCIDAAGSLNPRLFLETLADHRATVCGSDPIALLLEILNHLNSDDIYQLTLDYQTSGEITGDFGQSVSYAALAYCRRSTLELEATDGEALLDAAEQTLQRLRSSRRRDAVEAQGSPALQARRGLFVCLHQGKELLGCIGNCSGREPLAIAAGELTHSAALEDPRFKPAAEKDGPIDIELSVLSPFKRITSAAPFQIGRHGAFLRLGGCSGLLLPQVADDYDWNAPQFLSAVSRKAMLGPHAWKDPKGRLFMFEAQVFARRGR